MEHNVLEWCNLYQQLKFSALCIDVEVAYVNGPISVIGLYRPRNGEMVCDSYISGINLTKENLLQAFAGCKMLISFNGKSFDIPAINQQFPGIIPSDVPHLDLYLFAKQLNLNTGLKVLETTFNIDRGAEKKHVAVRLWNRYISYKDKSALDSLIEYNRQDAINLYPLAEQLVKIGSKN